MSGLTASVIWLLLLHTAQWSNRSEKAHVSSFYKGHTSLSGRYRKICVQDQWLVTTRLQSRAVSVTLICIRLHMIGFHWFCWARQWSLALKLSCCVYSLCIFWWTRPSMFTLLRNQYEWVVLCVMICRGKLLLDFLATHQARHSRSEVPTRGSCTPESHGLKLWYPLRLKRNIQSSLCRKSQII